MDAIQKNTVRTGWRPLPSWPMVTDFEKLLEATIAHVEGLKSQGVQFVPVATPTLEALGRPAPDQPRAISAARQPVPAVDAPRPSEVVRTVPVAAPVSTNSAAPSSLSLVASVASGSAAPILDRAAKEAAMAELRARALVCQKCSHLAAARKQVVFGVGDIHSPLMFVGEAPGADEDTQGEPFVGRAGQLLTRIIQTMGFARDTVYIANILKCRPDTPGQTAGNRKPTGEEMKTCLPYLLAQIDIIRPRVIVALGATAVEGLMGRMQGITRLRGQWLTFRDTPLMPTYHPAYLLRNQSLAIKREVWEDMLKVLERLELPISDKQRGYFLKS
jgi:DNA polymerase